LNLGRKANKKRNMFATYIAIREIEIGPCHYHATCSARQCPARATLIARAFDSGGRPAKQYALCLSHGVQIATREKRRGRTVLFLLEQEQVLPGSGTREPQLAIC
jgi:hypothetical protein